MGTMGIIGAQWRAGIGWPSLSWSWPGSPSGTGLDALGAGGPTRVWTRGSSSPATSTTTRPSARSGRSSGEAAGSRKGDGQRAAATGDCRRSGGRPDHGASRTPPPRQDDAAGMQAYAPVTDARLREPHPGDWLMYRRTYDGWGYSPLDQITAENVADLVPTWIFRTGIRDGALQGSSHRQREHDVRDDRRAGDRARGKTAASCCGATNARCLADLTRPHPTNRGVALYDDKVYVGNARCARRGPAGRPPARSSGNGAVDDYRLTSYITMAPLVVNGKVMVGTSGAEHGVRGSNHGARRHDGRPGLEAAHNSGPR